MDILNILNKVYDKAMINIPIYWAVIAVIVAAIIF